MKIDLHNQMQINIQYYFNIQSEGVADIANIADNLNSFRFALREPTSRQESEYQGSFDIWSRGNAYVYHFFPALFAHRIKPEAIVFRINKQTKPCLQFQECAVIHHTFKNRVLDTYTIILTSLRNLSQSFSAGWCRGRNIVADEI